jgi:hypothetical protein
MTWYDTVTAYVTKIAAADHNLMTAYIRNHAADHKSGGIQPIKLDELAAPSDATTANATTTLPGLLLRATAPASGIVNVVGISNGETEYTNKPLFDTTNPETNGTAAPGTQVIAARRDHIHPTDTSRAATTQALDTFGAPTDITNLDATTSAHGLVVKPVAPAAGLINVIGIGNGETTLSNKPLLDTINPEDLGTVSPGSQLIAARRDHIHAMPSASDVGAATTANKIDDFAVPGTSDTTKDANTTNHGLLLKAVAAANGFISIVAIGYGETSYALKQLFDTTAPSMNGSVSPGTALTASRIDHIHPTDTSRAANPDVLGTPTYTTLQDLINGVGSGGRIYGGVITNAGSGLINISALKGFIVIADYSLGVDAPAAIKFFDLAAQANWGGSGTGTTLTTDATNYVYVDYNSGTPIVKCTTDRSTIRYTDQFTIGRVFKVDASTVEVLISGINLYDRTRLTHEKWIDTFGGLSYANGMAVSTVAGSGGNTPYFGPRPAFSAGILYAGSNRISVNAVDCNAGGTFSKYYYNPTTAAWVISAGLNQLDNLNYNNTTTGTGFATLTANRYGVHWLYICPEGNMYILMGQGDYTLSQAQAAAVPSLIPPYLSQWTKLAAKIIVQKSSTTAYQIVSAWTTAFPVTQPVDHNSLADLQGGSVNEYYHLTAGNHTDLTDGGDSALHYHQSDRDVCIAKTTNITALNETGIADGEICVFNPTNKDIRTSDKTIVTTIGSDDTTVPTSKAVLGALPNRNAIINGDCRVNQRVTAQTLVKDQYTWDVDDLTGPDRHEGMATGTAVSAGTWGQSTTCVAGNSGYGFKFAGVTLTGTGILYHRHRIEAKDAARFKNMTASFSVKVYHDVGNNINYTIYVRKANSADNFAAVTAISNSGAISVPTATPTTLKYENVSMGDVSNGIEIEIKIEAGAITLKNFCQTELQLELGSVATAFEFIPTPLERTKCSSFFRRYNSSGATAFISSTGYEQTSIRAFFTSTLSPVMRSLPTLTKVGSIYMTDGTVYAEITSISIMGGKESVVFDVGFTGGATGRACILYAVDGTGDIFLASEL